jgi:ribA/ribD-fused uncharacterized protein
MEDTSRDPSSARTVARLVAICGHGKRAKFLFFWGHTPKTKDVVDKSCLSQWFPSPFEVNGDRFATCEHFMMAGKAALFGDGDARKRILKSTSPGAAKRIGREVRGFDQEKWVAHRFEIVVAGNLAKFGQNRELGNFLLATKDRILVEASPKDKIWGIGMAADHPHVENPLQWKGLNLLGFALMQARGQLLGVLTD